jgi:hypothetical protein
MHRVFVLTTLAGLTVLFLGTAAYTFWNETLPEANVPKKQLSLKREIPSTVNLTIQETGIASVSAEQLHAVNLRARKISPHYLNLTYAGQSVPFHVIGSGQNAIIYFYAQAVTNTLEGPAVYRLSTGRGLPMEQRDAWPTGPGKPYGLHQYRWEEDTAFLPEAQGNDIWMGRLLMAPSSLELPLHNIWPNGGPADLTLRVWSNTEDISDPDHHLKVKLNGRTIKSLFWDGVQEKIISLPLSAGQLESGNNNVLTISTPGDTGAAGEAVYVDWIHLYYEGKIRADRGQHWFRSDASNILVDQASDRLLIFEVTDTNVPVLLTNFQHENKQITFVGNGLNSNYLITEPDYTIQPEIDVTPTWKSSLRQTGRGADYIAIVANVKGFMEALQPLLDQRRQQGLRVTAVSLDQIYDEFGHGQRTPSAIRNFLEYASGQWQTPPPRFVLLVGDATYDVRDRLQGKNKNVLPTYLFRTEYDGYVASDTWFTIWGDASTQPGMAIGRFPAQTAAHLQTMVDKTMAYESNNEAYWTQRALLVADDEDQFDAASDDLASGLATGGYDVHELRMTLKEDIRYDIMSAVNKGVGLINYAGHGSERMWGDEAVFRAEDTDMLTNGNRLPVFTTFTCLNGAFAHPQMDSLAENLLWEEKGGIVAAVAPSGRSLTEHQLPMTALFYQRLLDGEITTLGEALMQAKATLADEPEFQDVMHTINLLGDPALQLQRP